MSKRRRDQPPANPTVGAGDLARCPRGHNGVRLWAGRDSLGVFLSAWCVKCDVPKLTLRKADLGG